VGEDVSELLDMIAAQMKVIQIARIKKSCRRCERMVQEPAPSRPIPGSMAGPNLLAHVLVSKFDDHLPLYRQHEIFTRMGADIPESTLVGWCGRATKTLSPLIARIEADIMGSDLLHADDTPIRVLDRSMRDKGLGKGVKQGRIWAYVRDQRPWAGASPPGAVYRFAPDWKEEHVLDHLADARGILQADGYKGYAKLYASEPDGKPRLREAACWAHLRRDFHDFWTATKSEIAREALDRIGKFYDIERDINGQPADVRRAARQKLSLPKVTAFFAWSEHPSPADAGRNRRRHADPPDPALRPECCRAGHYQRYGAGGCRLPGGTDAKRGAHAVRLGLGREEPRGPTRGLGRGTGPDGRGRAGVTTRVVWGGRSAPAARQPRGQ
jgi:transposase